MSDYIDTREGWREVDGLRSPPPTGCLIEHDDRGLIARIWVRQPPVPPLPTEPYTVIRASWPDKGDTELLLENGKWWEVGGDDGWYAPEDLSGISGWEPLASPANQANCVKKMEHVKQETAMAVLDRVCQKLPLGLDETSLEYLKEISREFRATTVEKDVK